MELFHATIHSCRVGTEIDVVNPVEGCHQILTDEFSQPGWASFCRYVQQATDIATAALDLLDGNKLPIRGDPDPQYARDAQQHQDRPEPPQRKRNPQPPPRGFINLGNRAWVDHEDHALSLPPKAARMNPSHSPEIFEPGFQT